MPEQIGDDDEGLALREMTDLARRFDDAARALTRARAALTTP